MDQNANKTDFAGNNLAQKKLITDALISAYDSPIDGSGADTFGWSAVAHLVMHWLKNPDRVPVPPKPVVLETPRGCICPPTSEQTCQAPMCPRKPVKLGAVA